MKLKKSLYKIINIIIIISLLFPSYNQTVLALSVNYEVYSNDGLTLIKGFDDLNSAINDPSTVDGCIIKVLSSAEIDNVTISKSITLTSENSSVIIKRKANVTGDLVTIQSDKTLTLENIIIDGNSDGNRSIVSNYTGTLVLINQNATLIMNSGSVLRNNKVLNAGGVYNLGTFIMNDGEISNNMTLSNDLQNGWGGGVYTVGTFIMNGGTIINNKALYGAGIFNLSKNSSSPIVVINSGTISNNVSDINGGGIYNNNYSKLNILGGTISYNRSGHSY